MKQIIFCIVFMSCSVSSFAEQAPYSGQESREIKSLSPEAIRGLLEGKGLGYAKTAELNGYPGPLHVLELSEELSLSEEQKLRTEAIFQKMKSDAKRLGSQLVEAERQFDSLFSKGQVSEKIVQGHLQEIGSLEGRLRASHINAHLAQKAILNKHQIHTYQRLRGYASGEHKHHHH